MMMKLGTLAARVTSAKDGSWRPFSSQSLAAQRKPTQTFYALACVCLNQPSFCLATAPTCSTANK